MPLEKVRNTEEEDQPLTPEALRDLKLARSQVAAGKGVSLNDIMRRHGLK